MSRFISRFDAVESRIASLQCPSGTPGRVHSLRLRRVFHHQPKPRQTFSTATVRRSATEGWTTQLENYESATPGGQLVESGRGNIDWKPTSLVTEQVVKERNTKPLQRVGLPTSAHLTISGTKKTAEVADSQDFEIQQLSPPQLIARLQGVVRTGDSFQVLNEIMAQIRSHGPDAYAQTVLATMPSTTFSEVLHALDPKHFISRFSEIYQEISPEMAKILRVPPVNSFGHHEFLSLFLKHLSIVLYTREVNQPLTVSDYRLLLKCARVAGDPDTARFIWKRLQHQMHQDLVASESDPGQEIMTPDVECYNHYMATLCWSDMLNPYQRQRLRITKRNIEPRCTETSIFALAGHKVGPGGLKATVATLFQRMVQQKIQPNEETLCLMIIAIAREGELSTISSILQRGWKIDVESILSGEGAEGLKPKSLTPSDPLFPTDHLLMALAHAYSINNSISTAIQLIDYVSRQYNISISRKIWAELLERSVMLSSLHRSDPAHIHPSSVSDLWKTMTEEPYLVKPDLRMYNYLIINLVKRRRFGEFQLRMREALEVHRADVAKLSHLIKITNESEHGGESQEIINRRAREVALQHLRIKVNRQYIRRWIRSFIYHGSRARNNNWNADNFSSQLMPDFVEEWALFLPKVIKYSTPTGEVLIQSQVGGRNYSRQLDYARGNRRVKAPGLPTVSARRLLSRKNV